MGDHYCCPRCTQRYEKCKCYNEVSGVAKNQAMEKAKTKLEEAETAILDQLRKRAEIVNWGAPPPVPELLIDIDGDVIDIHKIVAAKDTTILLKIEKTTEGNTLTYNKVRIPDLAKVSELKFVRRK